MKKFFAVIALLVATISFGFSQTTESSNTAKLVTFKLKNNSALPHSYTVITYKPTESGNGTTGFTIAPYSSKRVFYPVGTKIYLADKRQVALVMGGNRISDEKPFLLVSAENAWKTIDMR